MASRPDRNLLDRFRGCVLGAAVGDALGAPFQGVQAVDPADVARWSAGSGPLVWTDDTVMARAVGESLVAPVGLLGLVGFRRPVATAEAARQSARVTDVRPIGRDGAAVQARVVAMLVSCEPGAPDLVDRVLAAALQVAETAEVRTLLASLPDLVVGGSDAEAAGRLGTGAAAHESVPRALYAFTAHADSFRAAVEAAVALGGDADTVASMTGALAGALHGSRAIPRSWLGRLEASGTLADLAERLLVTALEAGGEDDTVRDA